MFISNFPPCLTRFAPGWFLLRLLAFFSCLLFLSGTLQAAALNAPLPEALFSDPELCAHAPCSEVLPGATRFSPRLGKPPYVEAYRQEDGKEELTGYVFLSSDIIDIPGYSGKPIYTLIGMDRHGIIQGVRILKHSEPLLLSGIPESVLRNFIHQYVGLNIADRIEVGASRPAEGVVGLDAISAATVTVVAENQIILHSTIAIAKQLGILQSSDRPPARLTAASPSLYSWGQLMQDGSIGHLSIPTAAVGRPATGRPYMDMYFGYLNAPDLGRSLLGEAGYENLMSRLKKNEHAFFVAANGSESFKGVGFVHGGIFDRILIGQDLDSFTFRDIDSLLFDGIQAQGAPAFSESAIFILRSANFSAAYPWRLIFRGSKIDYQTQAQTFINFDQNYWLPAHYLEGGQPAYTAPDPTWLRIWKSRPLEIALFVLLLIATGITYAFRDELARRASHKDKRWVNVPKYTLWLCSIGFVGFFLMAQPSITQVLTLVQVLLGNWEWSLFLSDPFLFLFWWFIVITVIFWGRGLFCGWLCPYGTLSELLFNLGKRLGLQRWQFELPPAWHHRLKWLKYAIFFVLLAASFHSMELAEQFAEVEPFKTTFLVGIWNRSWPFVLFWSVLMIAALFTERPFCKYLCPLGASLAIPSTFRWWELQRKNECGSCKACAVGCEAQAIDRPSGTIDQRECLTCLDCVILYYDDHGCPPLAKERKQRQKAGQPLTRIGRNGYFVPLTVQQKSQPVSSAAAITAPAATSAATSSPAQPEIKQLGRGRRLSYPRPETAQRASTQRLGFWTWWRAELLDLCPWQAGLQPQLWPVHLLGLGLAIITSWAWLLGIAGRMADMPILWWWLSWSAYEVLLRMLTHPVVREGPWWQRNFRAASWADMTSYVGIKNLLLASLLLFIAHHESGLGLWLQNLPLLPWMQASLPLPALP